MYGGERSRHCASLCSATQLTDQHNALGKGVVNERQPALVDPVFAARHLRD
jgi:hypothetical protein